MNYKAALISVMIFFFAFGAITGMLLNAEYKASKVEAYELSIRAMEQHIYVRDARAEEQASLIEHLRKDYNDCIKDKWEMQE